MIKIIFLILVFTQTLLSQDHWETAVFANDYWRYLVPDSEPVSNWNELSFDDSNWDEGVGGFGYGDGDDGTITDQALSVYFRTDFNVEDLSKLSGAIISADYDDGFIAYLNGIEVGRSYNLPEVGTFVPFDSGTSYDHEASLYNGGLPESIYMDSLDLNNILIEGQNIFAVQLHNINSSSSDLSGNFYLTFGIVDDSQFYSDLPSWFQEPIVFDDSNLPLVIIDTYGAGIPDEPRIPAHMGIINNESGMNHINDDFNGYDGNITIERRGNSSQWNDKTPYRFETVDEAGENNNVQLLGMPEENDWVLYAPWQDKTMIRNVLAYQLSNDLGRYASRTRFVELYLNNDYKGVYVLMEKIKRDADRVDISKLNPDEIEGDDLTGGYILKFDWYFTGDNIGGFQSEHDGITYNYHYPKPSEIVPQQEDYIQNYIDDFENIMLSNDYTNNSTGYPSKMNVDSFVDFILIQELAKNVDAYRLSTYIYKDKESVDGRLTAGPVWDFNHGFGNCDYGQTWEPENWLLEYNPEGGDQMSFWWELLWQDENFRMKVSQRYSELRPNIFSESHIFEIIDNSVDLLGSAIDRNYFKWPILGNYVWPNYYVFETYEEEVLYLKSWIADRLAWMDSQILQLDLDQKAIFSEYRLHQAYPNPFNPVTKIRYELPKNSNVKLTIYDMLGKEVRTLVNGAQSLGSKSIQWDATNQKGQAVSAGVYLYSIETNDFRDTRKILFLK
tara:strand:- start:5572 stop:7752 length:2181 start_codon:yes stop_codon:yes gene_type:complete